MEHSTLWCRDMCLESRHSEAIGVEMWLWRNVLHIKWTDKITNQKVVQEAEEKRNLVAKIKEKQKT